MRSGGAGSGFSEGMRDKKITRSPCQSVILSGFKVQSSGVSNVCPFRPFCPFGPFCLFPISTPNWPGYITAALTLSGKIALSHRMWLSPIDGLHTLAGYDTFGGLLNFSRGLLLYPTPKYQFTQVFQEYLAFSPTYLAEVTAGLCF